MITVPEDILSAAILHVQEQCLKSEFQSKLKVQFNPVIKDHSSQSLSEISFQYLQSCKHEPRPE